jgi:hypothetical protein
MAKASNFFYIKGIVTRHIFKSYNILSALLCTSTLMFLKMFKYVAEAIAAILTLETLKESPTILKKMRESRL